MIDYALWVVLTVLHVCAHDGLRSHIVHWVSCLNQYIRAVASTNCMNFRLRIEFDIPFEMPRVGGGVII